MLILDELKVAGLERVSVLPVTALFSGRIVYDTSDSKVKVWNGSSWVSVSDGGSVAASSVSVTPSGNLASTTVQAALSELQSDVDGRASSSALTTHTGSASAHAASSITSVPAGNLAASTVQTALDELQSDVDTRATAAALTTHTASSTAHSAASITNAATGNLAATTVQAALNELQSDVDTRATSSSLTAHTGASAGAHAASAISSVASGNLASTTVQTALDELQTDVDTRATSSALTTHTSATSAHGVSGAILGTTDTQTATNKRVSSTSAMTGALELPAGTVAQRPTAVAGHVRLNTEANEFEGYVGGAWQPIGAGLNEEPQRNYLKAIANASVPAVVSVASDGDVNVGSSSNWFGNGIYSTGLPSSIALTTDSTLRGAQNYLTAMSTDPGASTNGVVIIQTPVFKLDGSDLGKAIVVSFDVSSSMASGDWDVVIARYNASGVKIDLLPISGSASACVVTPSARLPTGKTSFKGFFVAGSTASDLYSVRFRRLYGASELRLDALFCGPQSLVTTPAVTDWVSYTPVFNNVTQGTGAVSNGRWRRVGDSMEILVSLTFGTGGSVSGNLGIAVPAGYNVDTTKLSENNNNVLGAATAFDNSASTTYNGQSRWVSARNNIEVWSHNTPGSAGWIATVPFQWAVSDTLAFHVMVPITNWASGVTAFDSSPAQDFAFNTTAWGTGNLTNFGYGLTGAAIAGALTNEFTQRVRFQSPFQPTDRFVIEFQDSNGVWLEQSSAYISAWGQGVPVYNSVIAGGNATLTHGACIFRVSGSSTDLDVAFGRYVTRGYNGTVIHAIDWANGPRWRVRKISGGTLTALPLSARNVLGSTDGSVVPAGFIGEKITFTQRVTTGAVGGVVVNASPLATLTGGVWMVFARGTHVITGAASIIASFVATNATSDFSGVVAEGGWGGNAVSTANNSVASMVTPRDVVIVGSAGQALYAKSYSEDASVNVTIDGFAVRIA